MPQPLRKPQADYAIRTSITPQMAAKYLERNRLPNRHLKESHVAILAREMREHRWQCNGEALIFDVEGNILDGQHRLRAIVQSGVTIDSYIVHGMSPDVMPTLDRGSLRSIGDLLGMRGESNRTQLGAALTWLWFAQHGGLQAYHTPLLRPTLGELEAVLAQHPTIRASCAPANLCRALLIPGLGTALHYLFAQKDAAMAQTFFGTLASGENLRKTDGLYHLRERLTRNRVDKRKLPSVEIAALTIKAWNAFRTGTAVRAFRWRRDGEAPEAFPEIL